MSTYSIVDFFAIQRAPSLVKLNIKNANHIVTDITPITTGKHIYINMITLIENYNDLCLCMGI